MKKSEENHFKEEVEFVRRKFDTCDSISPFITSENIALLEFEVNDEKMSFLEPLVLQLLSTLVGKKIEKIEKINKTDLECMVFLIFKKLDIVVSSYFMSLQSCYCVFHDLNLGNYEALICQLIGRIEVEENDQKGKRELTTRMFIESFKKLEEGVCVISVHESEETGERDENQPDVKPLVLKNRFCSAVLEKIIANKWYRDIININTSLGERGSKLLQKYLSERYSVMLPGKFEENKEPIWDVMKLEYALFRQTGIVQDLDGGHLRGNCNHSFSYDGSMFVKCHLEILMLISNTFRQLVEDVKEYLGDTNMLIITGIETYEGLIAFLEFCYTSRVSTNTIQKLTSSALPTMNLLRFCDVNNEERFLRYLFDQICPQVFSRESDVLERQIQEEIIGNGCFLSGESTVKIRSIWMKTIRDENLLADIIERGYEKRANEVVEESRKMQRKLDMVEIENEDLLRAVRNLKKSKNMGLKKYRRCAVMFFFVSILEMIIILYNLF